MRINTLTTSFADIGRLLSSIEACGTTAPRELSAVISAHEKLVAAPPAANPVKELLTAALDGRATPDKIDRALERAAIARMVSEERRGLIQRVEPELLAEFGRRLESGGGDQILDLLRPQFEDAALSLRESTSIVDVSADPAEFLQTASPEQVAAYQRIGPATAVLDRLSAIAAMLGPLGAFPCVEDPRNVDPTVAAGWLTDIPVMCCSSDLLGSCAQFLKPRPAGDVRSSPWLKTVPFLHTIASASERLRAWAERDWAAQESERLKGGRLIDGVVVPDAPWPNPFALEEAEQR